MTATTSTTVGALYDELLRPIRDVRVRHVIIGVNWTMVEAETGCGLAQTPQRDSPGCQPLTVAGDLTALPLRTLAELIGSSNPLEGAVGMAAINAFHNRQDLTGTDENGLDAFADIDGPVIVIGRFPGLGRHLKNYRIVEREPRPGEYPGSALADLVRDSVGIVITASTLANRSAEGIFEQTRRLRTAIVGPGTPLAPSLHKLGCEVLAGSVVEDADLAATIVGQSGAAAHLKRCCRYVTLRAA